MSNWRVAKATDDEIVLRREDSGGGWLIFFIVILIVGGYFLYTPIQLSLMSENEFADVDNDFKRDKVLFKARPIVEEVIDHEWESLKVSNELLISVSAFSGREDEVIYLGNYMFQTPVTVSLTNREYPPPDFIKTFEKQYGGNKIAVIQLTKGAILKKWELVKLIDKESGEVVYQ
jgi:hypothetical protein